MERPSSCSPGESVRSQGLANAASRHRTPLLLETGSAGVDSCSWRCGIPARKQPRQWHLHYGCSSASLVPYLDSSADERSSRFESEKAV
jgi:hypothetical protein